PGRSATSTAGAGSTTRRSCCGTCPARGTRSGPRCPPTPSACSPPGRRCAARWCNAPQASTSPSSSVPITTARIRTCRGSAISSPSSTRRARSVCHDSTNSFRPPRTVRSRRPSRVSCAGPIATRGPSRACMGRGRRSNDGIPRPSWRSRAWPSRSRHWRGAREGATAGRCWSSRGVRWCAVSSMMPSRAARPTTSRARSSRASRASRRCRGRWCGAVCTISCTTIPMRRAAAPSPTLVIWNPAARPRRGVMIADDTLFRRDVLVGPRGDRVPREGQGYRPFALATSDGHTAPVQLLDRRIGTERLDAAHHYPDQDEVDEVRIAFRSPTVPGLGLASAGLAAGATGARGTRPPGEGALVKGRSLVNHWIEVALEPTGALTLHDRRSGQRFTDLLRIEDGGDAGDTYTYCPPKGDRLFRSAGPIKVGRLAAGPLVAALEARFEIGRRVGIRLVAILYADSPMVRCILDIDNQAAWHRLRARSLVGLPGAAAVAGTAFGSVARPNAVPATAA